MQRPCDKITNVNTDIALQVSGRGWVILADFIARVIADSDTTDGFTSNNTPSRYCPVISPLMTPWALTVALPPLHDNVMDDGSGVVGSLMTLLTLGTRSARLIKVADDPPVDDDC